MINAGYIEPVQQQIGYAEHIGELLFFDAVDGMAVSLFGIGGGDLLFQLFQPADDKATGAAGEVYQGSVFDTMSLYIKSPKTP